MPYEERASLSLNQLPFLIVSALTSLCVILYLLNAPQREATQQTIYNAQAARAYADAQIAQASATKWEATMGALLNATPFAIVGIVVCFGLGLLLTHAERQEAARHEFYTLTLEAQWQREMTLLEMHQRRLAEPSQPYLPRRVHMIEIES